VDYIAPRARVYTRYNVERSKQCHPPPLPCSVLGIHIHWPKYNMVFLSRNIYYSRRGVVACFPPNLLVFPPPVPLHKLALYRYVYIFSHKQTRLSIVLRFGTSINAARCIIYLYRKKNKRASSFNPIRRDSPKCYCYNLFLLYYIES